MRSARRSQGSLQPARTGPRGRGCLLCNTAVERVVLDPACGAHVDAYFDRLTTAFRNALGNGRQTGEISEAADLDELAAFFTMALIGVAASAKGRADPERDPRSMPRRPSASSTPARAFAAEETLSTVLEASVNICRRV